MAGGSSGGHGFGVSKENNGKITKSKKRQEPEQKMQKIYRSGSNAALANDLRGLGRNNLGSRSTVQRIKSNENEMQSIRSQPRTEMHRMEERTYHRMNQTTRNNRTVLENAFRKQRRNKT